MSKTEDAGRAKPNWLLFFYSVPAKPTAHRLRVWRRLVKAGAVQLKSSVYALPYSEEHYELFQWLVSEVASMKGEAAFVAAGRIETMEDAEVAALFDRQREEAYRAIGKRLDEVQRKVDAVRNASGVLRDRRLLGALEKCSREFEEARKTDFFSSRAGAEMRKRLEAVMAGLAELSAARPAERGPEITPRRAEGYRGRTWVTRKRPFVDRMASAWLIRRFIDEGAAFGFVDEAGLERLGQKAVAYDMRGGEFTHVGELCTFEVLLRSFGIKDRALKAVAEVVHELDVKDDVYKNPEAPGVEAVLTGIRQATADDAEALEKGMAVFEMLYASKR
jgi:hypothetical protein